MQQVSSEVGEQILNSRILVVEDNEVNQHFLINSLRKQGFNNLYLAENGKRAIDAFTTFEPDLVILDVLMPEMDGYECCHTIRSLPRGAELPILIQTALNKPEERVRAFEKGATDFISKPVYADELRARVRVHLEKRFCLQGLQTYKSRVENELSSARELQNSILPAKEEVERIEAECGLQVVSYFEPSSEIGGDFWGIKQISESQVAFWIVDFSGHGVSAALNAFRLQAYLMDHSPLANNPGEYISQLNEKLLQLMIRGNFATIFYGIIDTRKNALFYASAGSPHPIMFRALTQTAEYINATGRPLGIMPYAYPTQSTAFYPGDQVFLYSDALIETPDMRGHFIDESMISALFLNKKGGASAALNSVVAFFAAHGKRNQRDDLTMALIKRADLGELQHRGNS